jgi:DNA-binding transcriptional LysR family regulator
VIHAAVLGQGIALGRMTLTSQFIREKRLAVIFGQQRVTRGFHAVFARHAESRPGVREFADWVRREIQREP